MGLGGIMRSTECPFTYKINNIISFTLPRVYKSQRLKSKIKSKMADYWSGSSSKKIIMQ